MPRQALADACREIAELAGRGVLTHPVAARYPLAECANAHRHQESGAALGNVLISVREPDGPRPAPA
jgi:NADPH2:quinone reductase